MSEIIDIPTNAAGQHNAHCLLRDYTRAREVAPYHDDDYVGRVTADIVRRGISLLQTHKLSSTDREHVAALLGYFAPPKGAHVLDAGCGVGAVAALMATLRPDLTFSLLNISAAQLDLSPSGMAKIHGDFHAMPLAAGSFDAVMFNFSLGHGLLDACMAEAARVLRPGGVLFIYDLTTTEHQYVIERAGYRPHSKAEVLAAADGHGFTATAVLDNPPSSTADWVALCGPLAFAQHGLDRARPILYRFLSTALSSPQTNVGGNGIARPYMPT